MRWQHPEHGLIYPAKFISVAEETGLIIPIGQWVLREVCRQLRQWQSEFPNAESLSINVNLCVKQFMQANLLEELQQMLQQNALDPSTLNLEITESAVMESTTSAATILRQLKELGVELSIDDFGTGYSALSYLHRFPIKTLKIDRSFVSRMDGNGNAEIVQTIILLAHNLGMEVVAEGVETEEQLRQLKQLKCNYGQGYLFSVAVDAQAAARLICNQTELLRRAV